MNEPTHTQPREQCSRLIFDRWGHHTCTRKAVVDEDGMPWCRQHAPSSERRRNQERMEKWDAERKVKDAERAKQKAKEDRAEVCVAALAGIPDPAAAIAKVREALERLLMRRHAHRSGLVGKDADTCATCGKDLRDPVHFRFGESVQTDMKIAIEALALLKP